MSIPAAETGLLLPQLMEIPDANAPSDKPWAEHGYLSKIISYTPAIKRYRRQQKQQKKQQKQQKQQRIMRLVMTADQIKLIS